MFCRYIKLQNGMRVLLVSDPTVQTSAAALDVKVGSFYDPSNLQVSSIFNITFEISSLKYLNPFFLLKDKYVWAFVWNSLRVCVTFVNTSCSLEASCFPTRAIRGSWQKGEDRPMPGQTQSIQTSGRDSLSLFLLLHFVHCVRVCQKRITSSVSPDSLLHILAPGS